MAEEVCTTAHIVGNAGTMLDSFPPESCGMGTIVVPTNVNDHLKHFTDWDSSAEAPHIGL